jgi:hypothetical protein
VFFSGLYVLCGGFWCFLLLEGRVLVVCVFDFFFFFCCKSPLLREALDLRELDLGNGLCLIRRSVFSGLELCRPYRRIRGGGLC